jgi:ADP-heptose:LPS heptosyltransferase/GT2 family glycosyltransferase
LSTKIVLRHKWALGDTVLLTALVRDIQLAYPDKYEVQVDTNFSNVWWNNPYVSRFPQGTNALRVEVGWGDAIKWNAYAKFGNAKAMRHILAWYHYDFERKTGIRVPVTDPRPDLHLSSDERIRRLQGRYWVVISGGKLDLTTKHWHAHRVQEVVDKLAALGIACVQVGAAHSNHVHPPLNNVLNLVGKTSNERDLWNIILHSDGVICGVTGAMHIAAAFEKPCVVYAGGREEPWFEAYVNSFDAFGPGSNKVRVEHKFLHTIGLLDCCDKQGCWKKRTVPLDPQDLTKKVYTLCRRPLRPANTHPVAACQDLIQSDHVVEAVMDYYDKGVLPPIGEPKKVFIQNPELKPELPSITVQEPVGIQIPKVELIKVTGATAAEVVKPNPVVVVREPSVENTTQKPYQQVHPLELSKQGVGSIKKKLPLLDDPIIGGKITVCVLCYGPYTELAKTCLTGLLATVPVDRLDLRVATNEVPDATLDYLKSLPITKLYINKTNRHKYPVMRDMFWDPDQPITTNYVLWLDDDTRVVQPYWISDLAQTIINNHAYGYRMYGNIMYHDLANMVRGDNRPDAWFRSASWYRGRNFRVRCGREETPNGSIIDFAVGWCWAISTELIRLADIPDTRLGHNGGDITIGEQVHQAGYLIKQWNKGKSMIACPTREQGGRRGYSEKFPWDR